MAVNATPIAPVDRLLAVFNAFMAVAWASAMGRSGAAPWMCAAHAAAAGLPWLIARAGGMGPVVAAIRHTYPLLWLPAFWLEIDPLRRALHDVAHDDLVRALDAGLTGAPLHAIWMPAMPFAWLSEPLHFAYFIYYFTIIAPLAVLVLRHRSHAGEAVFRIMLTYVVCFASYALFPVDGPHHLESMYRGPTADGFWYGIVHGINDAGGSLGAAFPSSHAAGAVTIACIGALYFRRWVAVALGIQAAAVVLATFYTQYHYAIDAFAGAALALALQVLVAPVLLRPSATAERMHVPRLPVPPLFEPAQRSEVTQ
jgi:membrane-associated phospholipid phosphatase